MTIRWRNTPDRYGVVAKALHWAVAILVLVQFLAAVGMRTIDREERVLGWSQGDIYNWHKSLGLVALTLVLVRYAWRKATSLPEWAPGLAPWERSLAHAVERLLYLCLFLMPVSGFLFVMAGGFGVNLFGVWELPRFIATQVPLARVSEAVHMVTGFALVAALTLHLGLVAKHQWVDKDGLLARMLPRVLHRGAPEAALRAARSQALREPGSVLPRAP